MLTNQLSYIEWKNIFETVFYNPINFLGKYDNITVWITDIQSMPANKWLHSGRTSINDQVFTRKSYMECLSQIHRRVSTVKWSYYDQNKLSKQRRPRFYACNPRVKENRVQRTDDRFRLRGARQLTSDKVSVKSQLCLWEWYLRVHA